MKSKSIVIIVLLIVIVFLAVIIFFTWLATRQGGEVSRDAIIETIEGFRFQAAVNDIDFQKQRFSVTGFELLPDIKEDQIVQRDVMIRITNGTSFSRMTFGDFVTEDDSGRGTAVTPAVFDDIKLGDNLIIKADPKYRDSEIILADEIVILPPLPGAKQ